MQTFLTSYNLAQNACRLDRKRLFKQLVEGYQILNVLTNTDRAGWRNHPAVKQWQGNEICLYNYIKSIWKECQNRKIAQESKLFSKVDNLITSWMDNKVRSGLGSYGEFSNIKYPEWWQREDITSSHRSRLKCKGQIDVQCAAIKKALKIKKIDDWLKENYGKTKNQLRYSDSLVLAQFMREKEIELTDTNFYESFGWSEGLEQEYVWPVQLNMNE